MRVRARAGPGGAGVALGRARRVGRPTRALGRHVVNYARMARPAHGVLGATGMGGAAGKDSRVNLRSLSLPEWLFIAALALLMAMIASVARAQQGDVALTDNFQLSNGDYLLVASVPDTGTPVAMVCFRLEDGFQDLGCQARNEWALVEANFILPTLALGEFVFALTPDRQRFLRPEQPDGVRVAAIRAALPTNSLTRVRARTISDEGLSTESAFAYVLDNRVPEPDPTPTPDPNPTPDPTPTPQPPQPPGLLELLRQLQAIFDAAERTIISSNP